MSAPGAATTSRPAPPSRGVSLDALYVLLALVLTALFVLLRPIPPHDYHWHLAMGRWIAEHGAVPRADVFSFTMAGRPFYDQPWLAQLAMYGLHRAGGDALVLVAHAALVTLAYGLLLAAMVARAGRAHTQLCATVLLLAIGPMSCPGWNVRPQGFALPLCAAFVLALARRGRAPATTAAPPRTARPLLPLLPALMVVWVNVHGSFVLGLVLLALTLAGEGLAHVRGEPDAPGRGALARLALALALTALATLANPRGPAVFGYVARLLGASAVTRLVSEWSATTLRNVTDAWFYLVLAALAVATARARRAPRVSDLALLVPFAALALRSERHVVWFGMVAAAPLAEALAARAPRPAPDARDPGNALVAAALLALLVPALPWVRARARLAFDPGLVASRDTGAGAVAALLRMPPATRPARLFHAEGVGSYLTWAAPAQRVFIDPRFELYPYAQWLDLLALHSAREVDAIVARYGFDALLVLRARDRGLLAELAARPRGFRVAYRDRDAVLLVRSR